jgi:DNA-binding SARP family transcriptional activator/nucleoid-associated protein YgaU
VSVRRSTAVARGLASFAAAVLLVVGVPVALAVFVGWPLPTSLPDGDALSRALRTGISDEVVVNTLAVIAWLAWSQLVLGLAAEVVGVVRGRVRPQLPVLPAMQGFATRLVAGVLLLGAPLHPARAMAAPPAAVVVVADAAPPPASLVVEPLAVGQARVEDVAPTRRAPDATGPTVTVERHDSYWAIAERTLGDGLRWREIHELNVGRTMSDGHAITAGDQTLRTGWTLELPAGATTNDADRPSEVVIEPGDNIWHLAEARLDSDLGREPSDDEVAPYWREVVAANDDRLVQPGNPDLVVPGQVLVLPPTGRAAAPTPETATPAEADAPAPPGPSSEPTPQAPSDATTTPSTTVTRTTVPPTTSTTARPDDAVPTPTADDRSPDAGERSADTNPGAAREAPDGGAGGTTDAFPFAPAAIGGLSSVALAVGLKRLIDRRRRRFTAAHDGQAPAPATGKDRALQQTVTAAADETRVEDLQLALGALAAAVANSGIAVRPRVVRHGADCLEVLLDHPSTDAPPGWQAEGDGLVWVLDEPVDPDEPLDGPMCPVPLLVTIGQPDEDANIYIDLEADGLVALAGDVDVARDLARSMVTELALAPLADTLRVIVIGDLVEPDAAHLDHLTLVETWADVADDLTAWAQESHSALVDNGWPNTFTGRGYDPDHDALVPIVVVATKPPPPDLLALLRDTQPSAVAVVVADHVDGASATIRCEADALTLDDIDLSFTPQGVDATELEDMGHLLLSVEQPPPDPHTVGINSDRQQPDPASSLDAAGADAGDVEAFEASDPPAYDVLVRLLGDIRVDGGPRPLNPKPTSVTAYLALHRAVTSDRLEEACWYGSDGTSHRKRLRDVMTECRDALGSHHLPANRDGVYRIGPDIRTDLELFDWHVARAADQDPEDAVASYREALDLVTGRPFSYANAARRSFGWVDVEHHATTWEFKVAGVAKAFAELSLDLGRRDDALDVLHRLLQAMPLNSDLVESVMRTHLAAGDRTAADGVYREHTKALDHASLGDPDDAVEQLRLTFTGDA